MHLFMKDLSQQAIIKHILPPHHAPSHKASVPTCKTCPWQTWHKPSQNTQSWHILLTDSNHTMHLLMKHLSQHNKNKTPLTNFTTIFWTSRRISDSTHSQHTNNLHFITTFWTSWRTSHPTHNHKTDNWHFTTSCTFSLTHNQKHIPHKWCCCTAHLLIEESPPTDNRGCTK